MISNKGSQRQPNILFLMCDQLQAQVFEHGHPCLTPNIDCLINGGVRFRRAYTPNAICCPARASLMTGLLPHSHGVVENFHYLDADQANLRLDKPHWAQRLSDVGYRTGYFGKWHVERTNDLARFGWQVNGGYESELFKNQTKRILGESPAPPIPLQYRISKLPEGYNKTMSYCVVEQPPEERGGLAITVSLAKSFLESAVEQSQSWCCLVSTQEPHDCFIAGKQAFDLYDIDSLKLPPSANDDLEGRPGLYRKIAYIWSDMTERQKRETAACYYAAITEIDQQFGKLIDIVRDSGQLENTIVILTSDHGELLGAHGLYCKNNSGYEEIYNIPLIMSGPGIKRGEETNARVGLHDICPTLLDLVGTDVIDVPDSQSFMRVLHNPVEEAKNFTKGFAEYNGGRYQLTQRIVWNDNWKFIHNGFDFDELYDLEKDPYEMSNLANDVKYHGKIYEMCVLMWQFVRNTNDQALLGHYQGLRAAPFGPLVV